MKQEVYITMDFDPMYPEESMTITNIWNSLEEAKDFKENLLKESPDTGVIIFKAERIE